MTKFEAAYAELVQEVLLEGQLRVTRNGVTRSLFGRSLTFSIRGGLFPLLQGRKYHYKGVVGEFCALIRQPKTIEDFEKWGCNYWRKWCKPDGSINVDYGNAWFDFDGYNQIAELKRCLRDDRSNRRMIVSGWRPSRLNELDLPCCHYSYQFYVDNDNVLHMIWTQRSVDMMLGLPADAVLASLMLMTLAREFSLIPGTIKMDLGDCHIYEEHAQDVVTYLSRVPEISAPAPTALLHCGTGTLFEEFVPEFLDVQYKCTAPVINFLLKE